MDFKTILLVNLIVNIICAGSIAIIWHENRRRFAGLTFWLGSMLLQVLAVGLMLFLHRITDFITIVVANTLLLACAVILLTGLQHFTGRKGGQFQNYVLLGVYFTLASFFTFIEPNITVRGIILSVFLALIMFPGCRLMLHGVTPALYPLARLTGLILGGYVLVSVARAILLFMVLYLPAKLIEVDFLDALVTLSYTILLICLSVSLIIVVNGRLLAQVNLEEEKFIKAFHSSPYAILLTRESDGKIFEANNGFVSLSGYSLTEAIGKTTLDLNLWLNEQDRAAVVQCLSSGISLRSVEVQIRQKSNEIMTGLYSADSLIINNERCILSSISDITDLSRLKRELHERATHDPLTGLLNRASFLDTFNEVLANAQQSNKKFAVISFDLDGFKTINDTLGHDIGDLALVMTAERLTKSLRVSDIVARYGGDEFVVLLPEVHNRNIACQISNKILERFRQPFVVNGHTLDISASMGIAMYPEDGKELNVLLKKSDESLYYIKKNGKNNFHLFGTLVDEPVA